MAKAAREKVQLRSTGKNQKGKPTGTFTTATVKKISGENKKLKLKKFDRRAYNPDTGKVGMHVWFEQKKLPKSS